MQTTGEPGNAFRECHSHGDVGPLSNPTLAAPGAWVWIESYQSRRLQMGHICFDQNAARNIQDTNSGLLERKTSNATY